MELRLEEVLDKGLEEVAQGKEAKTFLLEYPELYSELEPLLSLVSSLNKLSEIKPSPSFKARAKEEFLTKAVSYQQVVAEMSKERIRVRERALSWKETFWLRAKRVAVAAVALVFFSTSTVFAANGAMPDSPLYPVKRAIEALELVLVSNPPEKAELHLALAKERLEEIAFLIQEKQKEKVAALLEEARANQRKARALAGKTSDKEAKRIEKLLEKTKRDEQKTLLKLQQRRKKKDQKNLNPYLKPKPEKGKDQKEPGNTGANTPPSSPQGNEEKPLLEKTDVPEESNPPVLKEDKPTNPAVSVEKGNQSLNQKSENKEQKAD